MAKRTGESTGRSASLTRRDVIKAGSATIACLSLPSAAFGKDSANDVIRLGVIADLHGGFAADAKSRLAAFVKDLQREPCDGLIQLGDFAYPNADHQDFADQFNAAHETTIHVIGNHEFDHGLKRADCFQAWGIDKAYYVQDVGAVRVVVLDGNETGSPNYKGGYHSYIGPRQRDWLEDVLQTSPSPLLILSHQPLAGAWAVDNAAAIQSLLTEHRSKILACLNGHTHIDSFVQIDGVPYIHINSASYFWVGGEQRTCDYNEPLFTTVTIDPATSTLTVERRVSDWRDTTPLQCGYFKKPDAPPIHVVTPEIRPHRVSKSKLSVMTWNIWGRSNQEPRYTMDGVTARDRTVDVIRESDADVIAMIEAYGSAADIAAALGYEHHTAAADANLCIFSRYPLSNIELLEGLNPFSFIAATVTLPGGQQVRVYDVWLTSGGRHIVEIKNDEVSDADFTAGDDLRFDHVKQLLDHEVFQRDLAAAETVPVIAAGDFNCVSHLDHTAATARSGLNYSRELSIKVSRAMQAAGFVDTYRVAHPAVNAETLGHTWTTVGTDYIYLREERQFAPTDNHPRPQYRDPFARIDYVYAAGTKLSVESSRVIKHHRTNLTRSFPHFPSDHAAVLTEFRVVSPHSNQ